MLCFCRLLLSDNLSCIEFDQHCAIGLQLFYGNAQSKVVKKEELKFEVVKFCQWQAADLRHG